MPQPCDQHSKPQISCEVCYPDSELQAGLERMQSVKIPSTPIPGSPRKKPKRLDDPSTPKKKRSWRDEMMG